MHVRQVRFGDGAAWSACGRTTVRLAFVLAMAWLLQPSAAAAPGRSATGTWTGSLSLAGVQGSIVLQLQERASRDMLGYVLGGTGSRTFVEGHRQGPRVSLDVEFRGPVHTTRVTIDGRIEGDTISGTAADGTASIPIVLQRSAAVRHERRFVFVQPLADADPSIVQVAVVLDSTGALTSGAFVGERDCRTWACSGWVTSFSEIGDHLVIDFGADGGCAASADLTFDSSSLLYSGSYTSAGCTGSPVSGGVIAGRATRTRSDDAAQILEALGQLADDFGGHANFGTTHPAFSPGYLHYGQSLADVLAGYNQERATYSSIDARFSRIRFINTVDDPDTNPQLLQPLGAWFDEQRSGRLRHAGRVTYVDTHVRPDDRPLGVWALENGRWVIRGNQLAAMALPFEYTPGTTHLTAPTAGGPVYVSVGPYGAHFSPLTGHAIGDGKGNLMGFFTETRAGLTELDGDGDTVCEVGESCGIYGGPGGTLLANRAPAYKTPFDGVISSVRYTAPNGDYLGNAPKWQVRIELAAGQELRLDHVGRIAPSLRDKILAATAGAIDTDTYLGPEGDLPGVAGILVSANEELAFPQILAGEVAGHSEYYSGDPDGLRPPFVQMEFALFETLPGIGGDKVCLYRHLPDEVETSLQSVLSSDMADPASQRYDASPLRFEWAAEGRLCMAYSPLPVDFSGLYTNLGGWFEAAGPTTAPDEAIAFAPIAKDTPSYDASLYESGTGMLVTRRRVHNAPFTWDLPGLGATSVFYPSGEVLDDTGTALLITWRTTGLSDIVAYQRAAYILDESGLKVAWGNFASTASGAALPPLLAATPCDGTAVICYDHTIRDGY